MTTGATYALEAPRTGAIPRWQRVVAWAAFAVTVPSAIWRVLMIVGLMPGTAELRAYELAGSAALAYSYVFGLSIVQLACGYLTVGLVRPWGRRLWGRAVPVLPVVIAGALGGLAVTWLFDIRMVGALLQGRRPDAGLVTGWPLVVMAACYAPILLWGPLELVSVAAYAHRRRSRGG